MSLDTGDCSDRICPFEFAWVDTPDKLGNHHKYVECAAKGICDRTSGQCTCFPGYEGKACQRTTCPNDCSGHGQCTYLQNLAYGATPADYSTGDYLNQDAHTFSYYNWDLGKTRGCVCDPEYGDVDCSKRMCPYGTDVMDIRDDTDAVGKYQVQSITLYPFGGTDQSVPSNDLVDKSFALTFKSKLNETFTTIPIQIPNATDASAATTTNDASYNYGLIKNLILDVQWALEGLPNNVIDKVEVHGQYVTGVSVDAILLNVTFVGENVQGPQHPLVVRAFQCLDGCTPYITGVDLAMKSQNVTTDVQFSDYNSYECGRRGKCDYSTGICTCFAGYTGLSCSTITALV